MQILMTYAHKSSLDVHVPVQVKILTSRISGSGCSKLTMSLVNVSLKFQMLISEICQYFLLEKYEKLLHCKSFYHFSSKISVSLVIKS